MKTTKKRFLAFLLIIFFISGFSNYGSMIGASAQSSLGCPSNLTLHMTLYGGAPTTFNLLGSYNSGAPIARLVYDGTYPDPLPNGTISWDNSLLDSITTNSNYTAWTYHIRSGVTWSNGQPVTSQDILNTYSKNFALNSSYDYVGAGSMIKSENPVNSSTLVFLLNSSNAHFPELIGDQVFTTVYPISFIQNGPSFNGLGTDITDGPFYIANYTASSTSLTLFRNPYFKPQPTACEIVVSFVESASQTATNLLAGTADFAPVEWSNIPSITAQSNLRLISEPAAYANFINYNISAYPYNMTQFRQALAFGINQSQILNQVFNGFGTTASSSEGGVPSVTTSWYNPTQSTYSFNQTESSTLLSQIGITKSGGNLHYSDGTAVTLNLWTDSTDPEDLITAQIVQSNLQQLGFQVNLQTLGLGTEIGSTYKNANNIDNGMIIRTSSGPLFGDPYLDSQANYNVYSPFHQPSTYWEYPPSANAAYEQNFSAISQTSNVTLERNYLFNIQNLNSKYLPSLMLSYPNAVYAYNAATWLGWPSSFTLYGPIGADHITLAQLVPAGQTLTSSATNTQTLTSSATNTQTLSTAGSTTALIVAVIVILVIAAAVGVILRNRRNRT